MTALKVASGNGKLSASAPVQPTCLPSGNVCPTCIIGNEKSPPTTCKFGSDFSASSGNLSAYYSVAQNKTGVGEGSSTTSVDIDQDLQPATRFYWRARWIQGATTGDWSATSTFRTQIVGYNRPGELYDPLVNGATVAELLFKRTVFIHGNGLRIDDSDS